ncbi:glycosyltransferase family 69 protein [Sphaerobolus stellatus SS14]|uniref:Glycosyltransferase family 69 protein n=1 Tax=Sphaerobolus stellatus (strain SS14) TaxID=990650 RepID=A0A0C9U740_SPHS4|nr:glycosyltransferase family 69 protein [Sphaerobolus stellatus SS14]
MELPSSSRSLKDPWKTLPEAPATPFVLARNDTSPPTFRSSKFRSSASLAQSYVAAFDSSSFFPSPSCVPASRLSKRFASLSNSNTNRTIYLALNLIDAEAILPNFINEIHKVVAFMGGHRFYFSVWENGSKDRTPKLLMLLEKTLIDLGVSYKFIVHGSSKPPNKEGSRRIVELARVRNDALEELYNGVAAAKMGIKAFDMVLFMNDIIWCASDMLEIINEHMHQGADFTCATDWGGRVVYDRWVARTINGHPFYTQAHLLDYFNDRPWGHDGPMPPYPEPLLDDPSSRELFINLKPLQVFSCWNGAVVMNPKAFVQGNPLDNIHEVKPVRFRAAKNDVSEVTEKASECFLVCVDFWKRGLGKIMLVPRASVGYDLRQYNEVRQDGRRTSKHPVGIEVKTTNRDNDKFLIQWRTNPPKEVAYHDHAWWHEKERWGPWDEA